MDLDAVDGLLTQLGEDFDRRDGDAAVRTIEKIRMVAGHEVTDVLVIALMKIGLRRAAGLGIVTD